MPDSSDPLSKLFSDETPSISIPMDFNAQVWSRLSVQEQRDTAGWPHRLAAWVQNLLVRPHHALAWGAVLLLCAVVGGQVQSQVAGAHKFSEHESRYILSLDPYAKAEEISSR